MKSLRRHEGYVLRDNRASGGVREELPTFTCHHCSTVVVMNPLRTRAREYCGGCDHYICDTCGTAKKAGADCLPMLKRFEQLHTVLIHSGR